jgi:hypothetical protein
MKRTLDRALSEISGPMVGLRAVVLSAAPDGLIAWSWSRDDRHEPALGFAALDRAATMCLESLGASQRGRSLLLTAEDTWVGAWPLYDLDGGEHGRERLVITVVFSGALQAGLVMVYGSRIRMHLRVALDEAASAECVNLRAALIERVLMRHDAAFALGRIAEATGVELRRIARPELLSPDERRRLLSTIRNDVVTH